MRVTRLAEGLWRWTATLADGSDGRGRGSEVGCVYLETPSAIVLVDPLVPVEAGDRERFWTHLDRDVARLGVPLLVLLTTARHRRGADALTARYPGTRVAEAAGPVPPEVQLIPVPAMDEVMVWIPAHGALVAGDALLGAPDGGLQSGSHAVPRAVAELPVRMVLVSHGEPVLADAAGALRRLLT